MYATHQIDKVTANDPIHDVDDNAGQPPSSATLPSSHIVHILALTQTQTHRHTRRECACARHVHVRILSLSHTHTPSPLSKRETERECVCVCVTGAHNHVCVHVRSQKDMVPYEVFAIGECERQQIFAAEEAGREVHHVAVDVGAEQRTRQPRRQRHRTDVITVV
jgi:alpha-tubulin suppressor-like RCC1 family protein